jgi:hypothetical protein
MHYLLGPILDHVDSALVRAKLAMAQRQKANIARHVIQRILNPGFMSETASHDVAINVCQAYHGDEGRVRRAGAGRKQLESSQGGI